jgi:hypothetical protein
LRLHRDARPDRRASKPQRIHQDAGNDVLTRRDIAVEPQPGRLVMFESWLPHYVQCNKRRQVRISIAMNLREVRGRRFPCPGAVDGVSRRRTGPDVAARSTPAASATARRAKDAKPFLFNELFDVRKDLKLDLEPSQSRSRGS